MLTEAAELFETTMVLRVDDDEDEDAKESATTMLSLRFRSVRNSPVGCFTSVVLCGRLLAVILRTLLFIQR